MTFEVRVDCPSCRVEGARVELWDAESASARLGVPQSVECKLCRQATEGSVDVANPAPGDGCPSCGSSLDEAIREAHRCPFCGAFAVEREQRAPLAFTDASDVEAALATWAREEGLSTPRDLLDAYFVLPSVEEVFAALSRGERIETTFDVADYLFSSGGAGGGGGEPAVMRDEPPPSTQRVPRPASARKVAGPREELLALASVAAADGEASADDQQVLARAAQKRGVPPIEPADIRVWRPNEIEPPATLVDRERVLEEMLQMAWCDGQLDESELRVIRDFSRAWGIDPERLREWLELYAFGDSNRFERWLRRIGFFLFPAR